MNEDTQSNYQEQPPQGLPPKKRNRRKKDAHKPHLPHPDEKWLVSYSDMMTLLFGLFVMLYSIAMETQGQQVEVQKVLQAISDGATTVTNQLMAMPTPTPTPTPLPQTAERDPDAIEAEPAEPLGPPPLPPPQISKSEAELLDQEMQKNAELVQNLEQAQNEKQDLAAQLENLQKKLIEAEERLQNTEKEKTDLQTGLEMKDKALQTKQSKEKKVNEEMTAKEEDLKAAQLKIEQMNKEIADLKVQLQDLLKKMEAEAKKGKNLLIIARWDQEKYDIDLELRDPRGNVYNFKRRTSGERNVAFLAEANRGPGAEIIRINSNLSGKYMARVRVYNNRGENAPAKIELLALTPEGERRLREIRLDSEKNREQVVPILVEQNGNVSSK